MTRAVLFDFGGTLDADGTPWNDRFHEGYLRLGGRLPAAAFAGHFQAADAQLARVGGVDSFGLARMVEEQVRLLRRLLPDGMTLDPAAWAGHFLDGARATAVRNRPLLDALGTRFTLAVLSNFTGNLGPCLAELGLAGCFTLLVDSARVGVRKPDPALFMMAFTSLGFGAGDCWMVGDNPFADIAPAAALGCRTCWLAPPARPLPPGLAPDRRIGSLTELAAALG